VGQEKRARLRLPLPWVPEEPAHVGGLVLQRGADATLTYLDDGITLGVEILDPAAGYSDLVFRAQSLPAGSVALVAGDIPVGLRPRLRKDEISFLDVDGTVELFWPRLRLSASRATDPNVQRRTPPVTLRGAHARIVQALLISWSDGEDLSSANELAEMADASKAATSRALRKLAERGLVDLIPAGRAHQPRVVDPVELAESLRKERGWPRREVHYGYRYGRDPMRRAADLHEASKTATSADDRRWELAVTGIVGAAAHGVLTTAPPRLLKIWVRAEGEALSTVFGDLEIEPALPEEANCAVALDRYGVGLLGARPVETSIGYVWTAHPIRLWCDLHREPRGEEVAAQVWHLLS
jgi:hypothetical protein